jgi:hypothetical protein
MKKSDVQIGGTYTAKVSGKVAKVRIDAESRHGGWDATNLKTKKKVRIKSAQRLRSVAKTKVTKAEAREAVAAVVANDAKAAAVAKVPAKKLPAKKDAKPKRISALDAAAEVLRKAGTPMRSQDLIAAMADQGLWKSPAGKTPHATLYAAILREVGAKGNAARFKKVERGLFAFAGTEG